MVVAHGHGQWRVAPVALQGGIRTRFEEHLRQSVATFAGGHHQGRRAVRRTRIDVGSAREEIADHLLVTVEDRVVKGSPLISLAFEWRPVIEQPLDRVQMPAPGGELQRLLAVAVGTPHIGTALDEQRHHLDVAIPGGDHQPTADVCCLVFGIEAVIEPALDRAKIAALDGILESDRIGCRGLCPYGPDEQPQQ